jgi:hypothetical protein
LKLSRIDKTIKVDPVKMSLFDSTKNIHGLLISEFVDQKLEEFLMIHSPDEMQKLKIQKLEAELLEAKQALPEIEFMMKIRKQQQQNNVKKEEAKRDNAWLEKYELNKTSTATQVNRNLTDWKTIADNWGFDNAQEARETVTKQLSDERLLGCQACKKWREYKEYCRSKGKQTMPNDSCRNWEMR